MYINEPSVDRVNLLHSTSCSLKGQNLENLIKCSHLCQDVRHFMIATKKTLALET